MISFTLDVIGRLQRVLLPQLRSTLAGSLGGVESLIGVP